jgi:RNA polymerase sigma-70 factor (ECF subfamily)
MPAMDAAKPGDSKSAEPDDLIERASEGDRVALEVLLERYLPGLRGFVRLRTGEVLRARESSSDLVQSVCREVLTHLDRFQHRSETGFRQWLYATALRKIQNRVEYHQAQKRDPDLEVAAAGASDADLLACYGSFCTPSRELMSREEIRRIEGAFDRLPDEYREAIVLAKVVGLSRAAMAQELGRSEPAVRTLLSRALSRLAEILDEG